MFRENQLTGALKIYRSKTLKNSQETISFLGNSPPEVSLGKGVLQICSKFAGEHTCQSAISIMLQSILLHIFRTLFCKNTSEGLLLSVASKLFLPWREFIFFPQHKHNFYLRGPYVRSNQLLVDLFRGKIFFGSLCCM